MRCLFVGVLCCVFVGSALGQADSTTYCTFADGHQITVRYAASGNKRQEPENGIWSPNGSPMFLFTDTPVTLGDAHIPTGAYSLYLSGKKPWTLIVNRNTKPDAAYNQQLDLGRQTMESGELGSPQKGMQLYFVHAQPKQCNLRIYLGDTGHWADFKEQ